MKLNKTQTTTLIASIGLILLMGASFFAVANATTNSSTTTTSTFTTTSDTAVSRTICFVVVTDTNSKPHVEPCTQTTTTVTETQGSVSATWYTSIAFFDVVLANGTTGPSTWCWTYPQIYGNNNVTSSSADTTHDCRGVPSSP